MSKNAIPLGRGYVYLARHANDVKELEILEVCDDLVRHHYGWETRESFAQRLPRFYGRMERIRLFGWIPLWRRLVRTPR